MPEANFLNELVFWHWWIFAAVLLVLELLVPTTFLMWPGLAAVVVGLILILFPDMAWENQILIFGVLSAVVIVLNRIYLQRRPIETDRPQLNRRGEQYVGRTFTLDSPISNGRGRVRVDDTTWRVQGKDAVAGAKIIVTGVDGASLVVEVTSD